MLKGKKCSLSAKVNGHNIGSQIEIILFEIKDGGIYFKKKDPKSLIADGFGERIFFIPLSSVDCIYEID